MSRKKKNHLEKTLLFSDILVGSMLFIVVAIMPLIVRFAPRPLPQEIADLIGNTVYIEVFSYWKGMFIGIPAIVIAFYWVSDAVTGGKMPDFKSFFRRVPVILSCIYLFFVIISAIFSNYSHTAWFGLYDRSEGAWMWIFYFIIFFAAMFFVRETKYAKVLLYGLIFSSIIMGAIGVGQLFGYDFYNTQLAALLVIGRGGVLNPVFEIAHGTLFNPNTFGKYTAMLTPIMLIAAFTYDGKRYVSGLFLLAGALMILSAFGSGSLGGLVGILAAGVVLAVTMLCGFVCRNRALKVEAENNNEEGKPTNIKRNLIIGASSVIVVSILAILFIPPLNYRVSFMFNRLDVAMRAETIAGYNYIVEGNTMTVLKAGEKLYSVTMEVPTEESLGLTIRDRDGQEVLISNIHEGISDEEAGIFVEPRIFYDIPNYRTIHIGWMGDTIIASNMLITLSDGNMYGVWPHTQELIDLNMHVPAWGFYGRETWGSSRGYIFSRTFPLMPRYFFIGSGPDTFINVFPTFDLIGTQRFFDNPYKIVDKAHNIFLQAWITTGGISAIALYSLFGHYLLLTFVSLVKSKNETLACYGIRLGLLSGISGFVMSSMATDSTVGSTGVFFVLLGMGYGLNAFAKLQESNQQADSEA